MARYRAGLGMRHVALVAAAGLLTAACGGTIPPDGTNAMLTTPSVVIPAAEGIARGGVSRTLAQDVVRFSLVNGRFKFTTGRGDLAGTYGGFVTVPTRDRSTVAMTLQVTEGTRALAGATGTLVGDGGGAFVTGGRFVLTLTGEHPNVGRTPGLRSFMRRPWAKRRCRSRVAPTITGSRRLRGEGTIKSIGRSLMELDSEIFETECLN